MHTLAAPLPFTLPRLRKPQAWPLGIHPSALATMGRLVRGGEVRILRPSCEWQVKQFDWLHENGSYRVWDLAAKARRDGLAVMIAELHGRVFHADGTITDYGLLSRRVVTNAGVNYLAACWDGTSSITVFKYAGFGLGSNAESATDTALQTELTTQYAVSSTRPTGSQSHSTNTYVTVATLSPTANVTITEHGIFSVAASGSGTLWDRSVFSGIALVGNSDSLQATYTLTLPSGG